MPDLTAEEAAARLGVTKATLYAYVSRGLVTRRRAPGGRRSLFDPDEIDAFRTGRRRVARGEVGSTVSTRISSVSDGRVLLRGTNLVERVRRGAGYEAVFALLFRVPEEFLPWEEAEHVAETLVSWPDRVGGIERLRVACATASAFDALRYDLEERAVVRAARRILVCMVASLPTRGRGTKAQSLAARLWVRLTRRRPDAGGVDALDAALALLVDHGLATSTFAVRVAASVRADPYSLAAAGLGAVAGTLHGAASRDVHRLFESCSASGDFDRELGEVRRQLSRYPGFGHKVHRRTDPREAALFERVERAFAGDARLETVLRVGERVAEHSDALRNVDFALGALTWLARMDPHAGEWIFAIARTAGWLAHGIEECSEQPLRFRPDARYTGPKPEGTPPGSRP